MLSHKRPKIGLIFTGGGIAARRDSKEQEMVEVYDFNEWMLEVPEINLIAEIIPIHLFDAGGYEIGSEHWLKIAKAVFDNLSECDGFVITHGLDTIIYSASAVSFLLSDLGKPVIFTGSRFPPNEQEASSIVSNHRKIYKNTLGGIEAKSNLINSIQAATMDIGEVCILFGSKLLRANRSSTVDLFGRDISDSGEIGPVGEVNFGLDLKDHRIKRDLKKKTTLIKKIENSVGYVKITPQIHPGNVKGKIKRGCKGIVLEPYFMGEFPSKILESLKKAAAKKVVMLAVCSSFGGAIDFTLYPGGQIGEDLDIISALDMTPEAALTKLMVVLGQENDRKKVKKMIQENWTGEISK